MVSGGVCIGVDVNGLLKLVRDRLQVTQSRRLRLGNRVPREQKRQQENSAVGKCFHSKPPSAEEQPAFSGCWYARKILIWRILRLAASVADGSILDVSN